MNQHLRLFFHGTHSEKYRGADESEISQGRRGEAGSSEGKATLERTFIKTVLQELLVGICKFNSVE